MKREGKAVIGVVVVLFGICAAWADHPLPYGYSRLEWISVPKGTYVKTGFKPTANTHTVMKVNVQSRGEYWFGCRDNWPDHCYLLLNGKTQMNVGYGNEAENVILDTANGCLENGIHTVELDRNVAKIDGTAIKTFSAPEVIKHFPANREMYLFAENRKSGGMATHADQQNIICHWCRIYDNGNLIHDYIPCRDPDGRAGLWDRVVGASCAFTGTGTIQGSDACALNLNWLRVPRGLYIDTGFKPTKDTRTVMKVNVAWSYEYWFGCWNNWGSKAYLLTNGGAQMNVAYGNECENVPLSTASGRVENGIHTVELDRNVAKIDSSPIKTFSPPESIQGLPTDYNLYLFAENRKGTASTQTGQQDITCYFCRMYEADALIRDFVPQKLADGSLKIVDAAHAYAAYAWKGSGTPTAYGIAYRVEDPTTLNVYDGTLAVDDITGYQTIAKVGSDSLDASAVPAYPSLAALAGELTFTNRTASAAAISGTLTLRGGVRLTLDLTETELDRFTADALNFEPGTSAADPVIVRISDQFGRHALAPDETYPFITVTGNDLTAEDAARFRVEGLEAKIAVRDGVLVLTALDHFTFAEWTGGGTDATNLADPANWRITDIAGNLVWNEIPQADSTIRVTAGCTLNCSAGSTLTYRTILFASGASLGADCDWSGLDLERVQPNGTLDLAGHILDVTVPSQQHLMTPLTVTDSAAQGGTFRVTVPDGVTVQNTELALTGALKFAKAGAGTFCANRYDQTYSGGTEVETGTLTLPVSGSTSGTYSPKHRLFGAQGSSITVDAGAVFDMKGNYDFYQHPFLLNGGTLANTGCDMTQMVYNNYASIGNVTLLADSFIDAPYRMRFSEGVINLGGHTLTVNVSATYFHLDGKAASYSNVSNGTLVVTGNGLFNPMSNENYSFVRDMRTVDLVMSCPLSISTDILVRDLTESYTVNKGYNDGKVRIYGTYTPVSGYIYNFEMQDASTINLKDKTGAWSANPDSSLTVCKTLGFAADATVTVDLGGRTLHSGDYVISWNPDKAPANVGTVRFKLAGKSGSLYLKADGVCYRTGFFVYIR